MPLLLLTFSTLVSLTAAEIALRLAGIQYPIFRQADPITGTSYTPGARGWSTSEGRAYIEINRDGFRDREHSIEKPPNTLRVAVVGDSYTAAFQVPTESTFWSVLERNLQDSLEAQGKTAEVLAFGVGGYGTAQELLTVRHRVLAYAPDVVLVAMCLGNDFRDNLRQLSGKDYVPYFVRDGEELILDDRYLTSKGYRTRNGWMSRTLVALSRYLRLVQVLNEARKTTESSTPAPVAQNHQTDDRNAGEVGLDAEIHRPPQDQAWQLAWQVTEDILNKMAQEVRAGGARLAVVTLSDGIQVHPDVERREKFRRRLGTEDLFYTERRLSAFGNAHGIDVLALAPEFQRVADETGEFLHGFDDHMGTGHWNEKGHRLAGELIAEWLAPKF